MNNYFKYMTFRGVEELLDFHLRLTPPSLLNDPFEGVFTHDLKNHLKSITLPEDILFSPLIAPEHRAILNNDLQYLKDSEIDDFIERYGIISLTKSHKNLLMWAHYANEHKGICVILKETLFQQAIPRIPTKYRIENYAPQEVKYSNKRYEDIISGTSAIEIIRRHAIRYLFTKSEDWRYEDEYRCIIPMAQADRLVCASELGNSAIRDSLQRECDKGTLFKKEHPADKGKCIYEGPALEQIAQRTGSFYDFFFLKRINPSDIEAIILGARLLGDDYARICQAISEPESKLNHVKLYRCKIHPNLFTLDIYKIDNI